MISEAVAIPLFSWSGLIGQMGFSQEGVMNQSLPPHFMCKKYLSAFKTTSLVIPR